MDLHSRVELSKSPMPQNCLSRKGGVGEKKMRVAGRDGNGFEKGGMKGGSSQRHRNGIEIGVTNNRRTWRRTVFYAIGIATMIEHRKMSI